MTIITAVAFLGSVIGAWLVAKRKIEGYFTWMVANTLWLVDAVERKDLSQIFLWMFYLVTCWVGIKNWKVK